MSRICIVSHFAYGALTGGHHGHAGGVEQQTTMLARWLTARGHDVSLVTWDEGQPDGERIDGVRVVTVCRRDAGLPGIRFFQPRWSSLVRALRRADAEVYYQNCGDYVTGQVAAWCRHNGRRFVYSVASDPDCDRAMPKLPAQRERLLYAYGIRHADAIIVQTRHQQHMLRENFGLDSVVLPMPCPILPQDAVASVQAGSDAPRVLWAGRVSHVKRFDVLLDIAAAMPDVVFDVAGKSDIEDDYSRGLFARARSMRNVELHGLVPRERMAALYRSASVLLCTSDYEGFPNTFLEAWSLGVPVVSTVDPDGLLRSQELGAHVQSPAEGVSAIRELLGSPDRWGAISKRARERFEQFHVPEQALAPFERVLVGRAVEDNAPIGTPVGGAALNVPPRIRICFIAHPAWGEMSGGRTGEFGGIQRQLSLMARWYAARGHEVSMLTWNEGQPDEVVIGGVRVISMCRRDEGLPVVRFVHPRWTSLVAAMRRADADVYYQNTAEYVTGQAAYWCRQNHRGFIFSVANDWDCEPEVIARLSLRERSLYVYGLRHADVVVAQTKKQQTILREAHGVASVVIPMPSPPTGNGEPALRPDRERPRVVWVARIAEAKRLEMLLDLAELAPDITFDVAGTGDTGSAYSDTLIERGRRIPNVRMLGRVERENIPALYRGSACLCCTSTHEGFPNTFLEAWSQGVPVVSTFDPDGLIAALGLGGVARDEHGLLDAIRQLTVSDTVWDVVSATCRAYYMEYHLPEAVIPKFETAFLDAADRAGRQVNYPGRLQLRTSADHR